MTEEAKKKKSNIGCLVVMLLLIGGFLILGGLSVWRGIRPRVAPVSTLLRNGASADDLIRACKVLADKANKSRLSADQRTDAAAALIPLLNSPKSMTREEQLTRGYNYRMGGRVIHVPGHTVTMTYHVSDSALEALKAVSGQGFGKNASLWRSWLAKGAQSSGLPIASPETVPAFDEAKKQEQMFFKDTKNGYFMLVPPKGWVMQEYPDSRTKVDFNSPSDQRVFLRLIVRDATGETFESMKEGDEATTRSMRDRGISCEMTETEFMGAPSVEIHAEFPGGVGFTTLRKFIVSGLHFNIQYSAPTRSLFEKHRSEALASIDTLVVRKADTTNTAKMRMQAVDHYLRNAQLTSQILGIEEALVILNEASQMFPDDKRIASAIEEMKRKGGSLR